MILKDFSPTFPSDEQKILIEESTKLYLSSANWVIENIKPSNHRTAALRLLLESKMTLIHGITHPNVE